MEIRTTYIGTFQKNNRIIPGVWCGDKPENATIKEEKQILYPESGKVLRHKETQMIFTSVILTYDSPDNYEEIEEREITNGFIN